ncbi:MAG: S-layer homology domain-containing protein [Thermoleophilia bacterium]|nr:S-layer homology domain-containing protein [Thermoleophilia bacterium]
MGGVGRGGGSGAYPSARPGIGGHARVLPQGYVESLQLVGGRLAWQENLPSGGGRLLLYDPARDGAEAAEEASWTRIFAMDEGHLLWVDGADPTKLYLHDLLSGETTELLQASQPVESVAIGGQVVAWADRTGDRTTIRVHRLDEAETTTLDTFGPFYPDLDTDGRYVAWTGGENATGPRAHLYDTQAETTVVLGSADFQGSAPILDQGRVAWSRFFSGRGRQAVLVQDLATGLTTQLSNGPFDSGRPIMSGGTVVWTLHNPHYQSPTGRGVLVATAPKSPPKPAFADLAPNGLYRSATEWLGEQGYATGYPDGETFKFRGEQPLLRSQLGKLLVEILDIPLSEEPASFSDLEMGGSADSYAVRATATLANLGILKGTGGHRLEGYAPLSRAQAITLVVRAADYARPGLLPTTPEGYPGLLFTDPTHGANVTRAGFASLPDGLLGYVWRGERWLPWDVWAPISRGRRRRCSGTWPASTWSPGSERASVHTVLVHRRGDAMKYPVRLLPFVVLSMVLWASLWAGSPTRPAAAEGTSELASAPFSDIGGDPYSPAIARLAARGIVGGYPDGTFRPDRPVLRAQLAKVICLTLRLPVVERTFPCPFPDVETPGANLYPDDYVTIAAANQIVTGYADGRFRPYVSVNRAEAISMVVRGLKGGWPELLPQSASLTASPWGTSTARLAPMWLWPPRSGCLPACRRRVLIPGRP